MSTAVTPNKAQSPHTSSSTSAEDEAIAIACNRAFHQCLWLPKTASHDRLRVTFATTSNFSDSTLPIALYCVPMFGSRYGCLSWDHTAKSAGVRMIAVDRPGMGGSTLVPLNQRVKVWIETVPAVLKALDIKHVDLLFCHSAGTIYAMNTMYTLRHILHPQRPSVVFFAPCVQVEHSQAPLIQVASKIPNSIVGGWSPLNKFIQQRISPMTSWSGGIFTTLAETFQSTPGTADSTDTATPGERYGTSEAVGAAIEELSTQWFFTEDTTAGTEEARMCLRKCEVGAWGVCEDYAQFVRMFGELERGRREARESEAGAGTVEKVKVKVYFAESDVMIGKIGRRYFEECWRQSGVEEWVDFEAVDLPGTNHDSSIGDLKKGGMKGMMEELGRKARD